MSDAVDPTDGEATVARARQAARELQRALTGPSASARAAAMRLVQVPELAHAGLDDVVAGRVRVLRRHAHDAVALEAGFAGWAQLLAACLPELQRVTMHCDAMGAWLNVWCTRYEDAAAALAQQGGVLLPYRTQFVVAPLDSVRALGLDPHDPDWQRIGHDWVRPRDPEARLRLARVRWAAMLAAGEDLV